VANVRALLAEKRSSPGICRDQRFADRPKLTDIFRDNSSPGFCARTIEIACRHYGYKQKDVAEFLGVHPSTVLRALRRNR
jgi:hypothetical protein